MSEEPAAPRRPRLLLRFGVALPVLAGALLWAAEAAPGAVDLRESVADATAVAAGHLLPLAGYDVRREGRILRAADGHGVKVGIDCDAVPVALLFLAAVAVSPVPWRRRVLFAPAGIAALFLLNQARIGHLLWISNRDPAAFHAAHEAWWPAGLVLAAGAMFLVWARREARAA